MRIAVDVTYALDPEPSGVARYSDRIARQLAKLTEIELTLCARWPRVRKLRRHFAGVPARACWLQEPFNRRLPRRVDVFHGLNQRLPGYKFRGQVVTIHDVFPMTSESYSTAAFRRRFSAMIASAAARADHIVCVSAYTRDELCRVLTVPPEKCSVIHHGIEQHPPAPSPEALARARALAGGGPFFLAVGAVQVRKNTATAIETVAAVPSLRLVVAGAAGHGAAQAVELVRRRGLAERVCFLGYVPDETLAALYALATALLFPSTEEGFGLPVLEAMARGLPVIASNTSSLPEVAGDAAVLAAPTDVEAMSRAARRMLEDGAWREQWRARGLERAGLFTWERAAQATLDAYRALC